MLIASALGGIIWAVAARGVQGLGILWFAVPSILFGVAVRRVEVRATPDALIINRGVRARSYRWHEVMGFCVERGRGRRRVLVQVSPHHVVELPVANGGPAVTPRRKVEHVWDQLESYRRSLLLAAGAGPLGEHARPHDSGPR